MVIVFIVVNSLQPFAKRMAVVWIFVEFRNSLKFVSPWLMAGTSQTSFWTQKNHVDIFPDVVATI